MFCPLRLIFSGVLSDSSGQIFMIDKRNPISGEDDQIIEFVFGNRPVVRQSVAM